MNGEGAGLKLLVCVKCEQPMEALRSTKRYCSESCRRQFLYGRDPRRSCRRCGAEFMVVTRGDANRQYCSKECAKTAQAKTARDWQRANPGRAREHSRTWTARNPDYYQSRGAKRRAETLDLLGAACVVCGVTEPTWLHIDYIPTCRGMQYRHPRGPAYVREHLGDFRILCANHHYELTLTGRIRGTDITQ